MTDGPRILAVMGSGETAPAMAKVHRALFERFRGPVAATIIDTPYGFQENADDLSARTLEFFFKFQGVKLDQLHQLDLLWSKFLPESKL